MTRHLLVHVGYHKTATTWMQRQLFVPEHGYFQLARHEEVFNHIVRPHGLTFDPEPMRDIIDQRINDVPQYAAPLISSEVLCGNPFFGGRGSDAYAERLQQIVPDARILISIRSQIRVLPSVYMQYISRGGTMPPKQFFDGDADLGYVAFDAIHFEYDRLIEHYQNIFGRQNVLVITQESLRTDLGLVTQRIADFSQNRLFKGLSPGAERSRMESYPEYSASTLRRINHFQKSMMNPRPVLRVGNTPDGVYRVAGYLLKSPIVNKFLYKHRPVSDYVRSRFAGEFAFSNRRLDQITGYSLDLSDYDGVGEVA